MGSVRQGHGPAGGAASGQDSHRSQIRTYNTCAGADYIRNTTGQNTTNFGLGSGAYDDLNGFLTRADELALSLLDDGISAMKIWPFDGAAERSGGRFIGLDELKAALVPFERIRKAVGDRMEIMVEPARLWQLLPAMQIARALAPFPNRLARRPDPHEQPVRSGAICRRFAGTRWRLGNAGWGGVVSRAAANRAGQGW